jgi:hypothetical protein
VEFDFLLLLIKKHLQIVDPDKKEKENVNGYERHELYPGQKIYFIENQYQQYQQKDHQHDIDQAVGRE